MIRTKLYISLLLLASLSLIANAQVICTLEYDPTCCSLNGEVYTAGNLCQCTGNEGVALYSGECEAGTTPSTSRVEAEIPSATSMAIPEVSGEPEEADKVSAIFPPIVLKNAESALEMSQVESAAATEDTVSATVTPIPSPVQLPEPEFGDSIICPTDENPVCCKYSDGSEQTKSNSCFCSATFGTVTSEGSCVNSALPSLVPTSNPLPCTEDDPKVCCRNSETGVVETANNVCDCESSGATVLYFGECTF